MLIVQIAVAEIQLFAENIKNVSNGLCKKHPQITEGSDIDDIYS